MIRRLRNTSTSDDAEPLRRIDRLLEFASLLMFPLGLTALLLGWFGVASTGHVFLQLPYLVSGGLVGVSLVVLGGMLYLASWISRTAAVQRRQNEQILAALAALGASGALSAGAGPNGATTANGGSPTFVATPRGSMFHRPDCAVVTDRTDVRTVTPDADDMKPCGMCTPLAVDDAPPHVAS